MLQSLINYLDARLNPIMVKEIYQGFRSRSFLVGLFLALLIPLGAYMTLVLGVDADRSRDNIGAVLFGIIAMSMIVAGVFLIPAAAGAQLRNEITSHTIDLISITQLSPWAIVMGRFQAAALHVLLLFAFTGPFALAAFLLGGIGAIYIMTFLVFLFIYSLAICSIMLMLSALPALHPHNVRLAYAAQGLPVFLMLIPISLFSLMDYPRITSVVSFEWSLMWELLNLVALLLIGALFCIRMAADMLLTASIRSFFYSKLFLFIWLLTVSSTLIGAESTGSGFIDNELTEFQSALCLMVLFSFATFWSGLSGDTLTTLKRNWLYPLFGDGYFRTLLYTALCSMGLAMLFAMIFNNLNWSLASLGLLVSFIFYTGIARLVLGFLPIVKRNARHYYIVLLGIFILQIMLSNVFIGSVSSHTAYPSFLLLITPLEWFEKWEVLHYVAELMWVTLFIGLFAAGFAHFRQQKGK